METSQEISDSLFDIKERLNDLVIIMNEIKEIQKSKA